MTSKNKFEIKIPDDPLVRLIFELNDFYLLDWRKKYERKMKELRGERKWNYGVSWS